MGKRIIEIDYDDLTGEENIPVTTTTLAIDGFAYELDLGEDSERLLHEGLAPFLRAARRPPLSIVKAGLRAGDPPWLTAVHAPTQAPGGDEGEAPESLDAVEWAQWAPDRRDDPREARRKVREWCKAKGWHLNSRAPIAKEYREAYQTFYADRSNWAPIPAGTDLDTAPARALGAAETARRAS
ncbi:histone-like nucleoid-structuring protein Lsr2 [Streptosporangium sp. NPDC020072]|uniref:Lsr2 dimerization domain-containing protein n=1 Tax=Streptosporangium sp. NPDC020072 TaxID=3154788 RepID=UPI00342E78EB